MVDDRDDLVIGERSVVGVASIHQRAQYIVAWLLALELDLLVDVVLELDHLLGHPSVLFLGERTRERQHPGARPEFQLRDVGRGEAQHTRDHPHGQGQRERRHVVGCAGALHLVEQFADGGLDDRLPVHRTLGVEERVDEFAVVAMFGRVGAEWSDACPARGLVDLAGGLAARVAGPRGEQLLVA